MSFQDTKSLDFQGPPLPMALVIDFPSSRWGVRSLFTFITVADVIAAVGFPWVLAMVSAIAGVLGAAVVFTAVDIPGVPAVAKVSAATPIVSEVLSPTGFSNVSGFPDVVGVIAVVSVPTVAGATVVNIPSV